MKFSCIGSKHSVLQIYIKFMSLLQMYADINNIVMRKLTIGWSKSITKVILILFTGLCRLVKVHHETILYKKMTGSLLFDKNAVYFIQDNPFRVYNELVSGEKKLLVVRVRLMRDG
jgi:hypothetical protein